MRCKKAHSSLAAHNSVVDVVIDGVAGYEISGRITDPIGLSSLLESQSNSIPVR